MFEHLGGLSGYGIIYAHQTGYNTLSQDLSELKEINVYTVRDRERKSIGFYGD